MPLPLFAPAGCVAEGGGSERDRGGGAPKLAVLLHEGNRHLALRTSTSPASLFNFFVLIFLIIFFCMLRCCCNSSARLGARGGHVLRLYVYFFNFLFFCFIISRVALLQLLRTPILPAALTFCRFSICIANYALVHSLHVAAWFIQWYVVPSLYLHLNKKRRTPREVVLNKKKKANAREEVLSR